MATTKVFLSVIFDNDQTNSGWMYLEISTKESAEDYLQAEAAGILEGYLTKTFITEAYKEFFANDVCKSHPEKCLWIEGRFRENWDWMQTQILTNWADPYWYQVSHVVNQIQGMKKGLLMKKLDEKPDASKLDVFDYDLGVLLLNLQADFWDLVTQYDVIHGGGPEEGTDKTSPSKPSCSVLIKYLPEENDVLVAHNTWHEYRAMTYKVIKRYELNYHSAMGELIPGHTTSMSSYAGSVASLDDFYLISSGLAATETSLFVYDSAVLANLSATGIVYEPFRVLLANRMAKNSAEWQDIFKRYNSGTYNNQWMVLDYNKIKEGSEEGLLTVSEQLPGMFIAKDQTKKLKDDGYWSSYNRAFYSEIFEKSGAPEMVTKFGDWFTHKDTPRAKIFRREQKKVQDTESLMSLMRSNNYESDEYSKVDGCSPSRIPAAAIANRLDISDPEGNCTFANFDWMVGHSPYGALDAKVARLSASIPDLVFKAVAGPTHSEDLKPFKWTSTGVKPVPKFRTIDEFDFEPITFKKSKGIVEITQHKPNEKASKKTPSTKIRRKAASIASSSSSLTSAVVVLLTGIITTCIT